MTDTYSATLARVGRFSYCVRINHNRGDTRDPYVCERFVMGRKHAERVAKRWLTKICREALWQRDSWTFAE